MTADLWSMCFDDACAGERTSRACISLMKFPGAFVLAVYGHIVGCGLFGLLAVRVCIDWKCAVACGYCYTKCHRPTYMWECGVYTFTVWSRYSVCLGRYTDSAYRGTEHRSWSYELYDNLNIIETRDRV